MLRKEDIIITNYIDDITSANIPTAAQSAFQSIRSLLGELGLAEAESKLCPPSTQMDFLGIHCDTEKLTLRIPNDKLTETIALLRKWKTKTTATKHQLQSLLGKLHHISQCVRPARLFLGRMLETLQAAPDLGHMPLSSDFKKDVNWFLNFMPSYNGVNMMSYPEEGLILELDACLSGVGGRFDDEIYHTYTLLPDFILAEGHHITHLEMLNIVIATKLWKEKWSGHHIVVSCDNAACVSVLNTGKGRNPYLLKCAREIWLLSALHDFTVSSRHCSSASNYLADTLSRMDSDPAYKRKFDRLHHHFVTRIVDPYMFKLISSI